MSFAKLRYDRIMDQYRLGSGTKFVMADGSGNIDPSVVAGVKVAKAGTLVGTRSRINFIEGANVTITAADDSGDDEIDVTIASSGGGGGGWPFAELTTPPSTGWSWDNQGSSTVDSSFAREYVRLIASGGLALRLRYRSAPSAPYSLKTMIVADFSGIAPSSTASSAVSAGLFFRDSSGKLIRFNFGEDSGWEVITQKWTTSTSGPSTYKRQVGGRIDQFSQQKEHWLGLRDDNTNLKFFWSLTGFGTPGVSGDWYEYDSRSRTDHFTSGPTQIGYGGYVNGADVHMALMSWEEI